MEEQGEIIFKMQQGKFLSQTNSAKISLYPTNLAKIPFNLLQKQDQSNSKQKETLHYEVYKSDSQCSPIKKWKQNKRAAWKMKWKSRTAVYVEKSSITKF